MSNAGSLSGLAEIIGGGSSLANGVQQYGAYNAQGKYQRGTADINAQMMQLQAKDAVTRGNVMAARQLQRGADIKGIQTANAAGSGTDVNSGTNALIQANTDALSQLDSITIQNNAAMEAIGYRMEAVNMTAQGKMAQISGRNNASQSLISGGMQFATGAMKGAAMYDRYRIHVPGPEYGGGFGGPDSLDKTAPDFGGGSPEFMNA